MTADDTRYFEMLVEVIGAKMNEDLRRGDAAANAGHHYAENRADGAACALRDILIAVAAARKFHEAVPPRLKAWSESGHPWRWPLLPEGGELVVCWCGDENDCCQPVPSQRDES